MLPDHDHKSHIQLHAIVVEVQLYVLFDTGVLDWVPKSKSVEYELVTFVGVVVAKSVSVNKESSSGGLQMLESL